MRSPRKSDPHDTRTRTRTRVALREHEPIGAPCVTEDQPELRLVLADHAPRYTTAGLAQGQAWGEFFGAYK